MSEEQTLAEARIDEAIRRIARFHKECDYQRLVDIPLIPPPASEQEIETLEVQLGCSLPAEYRMVLNRCKYLFIFEGYRIWGIDGPGQRPGIERWEGRDCLVFGDYWRDADGDNLVLDLDSPPKSSILVWHHDEASYEFLAPSLSVALCKIVDELFPEEHFEEAVRRTIEEIRFAEKPWWKRLFGGASK